MRGKRFAGAVAAVSLLLGTAGCGDDDDVAEDDASTTVAEDQGPTAVEVTLSADGLEGMPSELPAGLVEITLVNETGGYSSLDISRVEEGTTEDEFLEGMAPLLQGGEFPGFFESNAGVEAEEGTTATSLVVLQEGEHFVWFELSEGDDEETGEAGDADEGTEPTTTTTAVEEDAAGTGEPAGTLTAVGAEDDSQEPVEEEEPVEGEPEGGGGEEGGAPQIQALPLAVTEGDADAELPEADGEIVATDYEFDATLDGSGTINFRNDGPEQFHHAVMMDFGTNDPAAVEEAFPTLLESEGDPSAEPPEGIDMEQVDFEFAGSGVFGPDGAAGTFDADVVEGNTYVIACFIQDRTGGPPHAIAHDMWEVVQAGGGDTSETTEG